MRNIFHIVTTGTGIAISDVCLIWSELRLNCVELIVSEHQLLNRGFSAS